MRARIHSVECKERLHGQVKSDMGDGEGEKKIAKSPKLVYFIRLIG